MPESTTDHLDYYPQGWSEYVEDDTYIEWIYEDDPEILVRLDGTMGDENYTVSPITGVNQRGEEFSTGPISELTRENAFRVAKTLIYAINGAIGRVEGESEFTGDKDD